MRKTSTFQFYGRFTFTNMKNKIDKEAIKQAKLEARRNALEAIADEKKAAKLKSDYAKRVRVRKANLAVAKAAERKELDAEYDAIAKARRLKYEAMVANIVEPVVIIPQRKCDIKAMKYAERAINLEAKQKLAEYHASLAAYRAKIKAKYK